MEASATLDIGDLHLAIGNLSDEVRDLRKRLITLQDDLVKTGTATCPTPTGAFFIDLGGPAAGKWWQIRNLVIGGDDITVAAAGATWVIVMAGPPSINPPLFALRDFNTTMPYKQFYGDHQLIVQDTERLYVVVTTGTAGQQYVANACIESFPQFVKESL